MRTGAKEKLSFATGEGELASLVAEHPWHTHALGVPEAWPPSLKTALQILLASPQPGWLIWGPDDTLFYNDGFRSILGAGHPRAFARPAREGLGELWAALASSVAQVRDSGQPAQVTARSAARFDAAQRQSLCALAPVGEAAGRAEGVMGTLLTEAPPKEHRSDDLSALQHKLLELTLQERPLELILEELTRAVQAFIGSDSACSILLTKEDGDRLFHGSSVGLSDDYNTAIDGIAIGPDMGSCGTAAHRRAPVLVADIATDPLWAEFRDLALPLGLRACWSHPVIGTRRKVLGTFAIYRAQPGLPSAAQNDFLDLVAQVTALILERYEAQAALNDQTRLLETLNRTGAGVAAELDHEALIQMVTDAGVELTGAQFGAFFYNVVDGSNESYMLYTLSGVENSAFSDFPMPRNTKVFAPTFAGDGIIRSDDITSDPRYGRNAPYNGMPKGHLPVRSYLAVPVISRSGRVLGGLFFGHEDPARFSQHHEKLMDGLAGQAAIALDNAFLYQSAQREIEERRRAEHTLLKIKSDLEVAQERVELALAAGAIVGTWIWHVPSDTVTTDDRFAETFGLDPERGRAGMPLAEVSASIHPEDAGRVKTLIEQALREGGSYRAEYRARHSNGQYRWVEASGYCELDSAGQAVRFPGVLMDIEQRRRIESDLKRREADLALLLDSTADGFYAVDKAGCTTRCNAAFLRMLGFESEDQVIGKQLHDLIHHSHADGSPYPREDCPIYHVARTGEAAHVSDEVFYRTDGTSFPVEYWVRPVVWKGELQGAVCNILDISERKRAEEARQLLMRELNHRVKNLFAIVAGMIKMTARHAESVEDLSQALGGRVMALSRAHELISSSITSRQSHEAFSGLDRLIEVVLAPYAEARDGALRLEGPTVEIGPTATTGLALILHELATNSAKYGALSAPEGIVTVRWAVAEETMTLTWTETGGPEVRGAPDQTGFGSQLARLSATGQLGGSIEFAWVRDGVDIRLTAALERLAH